MFTGAKVLARQAAEQLYACQQEAERDKPQQIPPSDTRQDQSISNIKVLCLGRAYVCFVTPAH